jgi:hypothetical protein
LASPNKVAHAEVHFRRRDSPKTGDPIDGIGQIGGHVKAVDPVLAE